MKGGFKMRRHACSAFMVVLAAALGTTSTSFDGAEAPWARASRQLFLGATSFPPPSRCTDACVFASEDDGDDCNDDGAPGSEFPLRAYCIDGVDCCPRVPRAPPTPPAGTPSGTGSPDGQLGTDGADYGPGQSRPSPAFNPVPLRAGTGICMKNCFCDASGSGSEYPMPIMNIAVVGTRETRAAAGSNHAVMGTVRAVIGSVRAVVRMVRAVMGTVRAVMGNVRAVMGNVRAVMGNVRAVMGNVRPVVRMTRAVMDAYSAVVRFVCAVASTSSAGMGTVRAVMGTLRVVKSTIRDFASTPRADMGTMSAVASTKPASGKRLASIGVESTGGIYVYDFSTPAQPRFRYDLNVCNWRLGDLTCGETCFYVSGGDGDDGVAGMEDYFLELTCNLIQERTLTIPDEPYLIELTCNLNDGPKSLVCISSASRLHLVCIWAADSPLDLYDMFLAGGLTAYIIECGPLRGNDGSCSNINFISCDIMLVSCSQNSTLYHVISCLVFNIIDIMDIMCRRGT